MKPDVSIARIHNWTLSGKPFEDWKVFLALDTYSILAEAFSWEAYTPVIKQYYTLPLIRDNNQKLDLWARKFSQAVNTNLCPYFAWFQWPLTKETTDLCATLPSWNQNPLERYDGKDFE